MRGHRLLREPVALNRTNLDFIASEIENIREGQPMATKLGAYEAKLLDTAICQVMAAHLGACAALLKPFNGPDGTENAYDAGLLNLDDCCYPTEAGQRLIAKILFKAGLEATP